MPDWRSVAKAASVPAERVGSVGSRMAESDVGAGGGRPGPEVEGAVVEALGFAAKESRTSSRSSRSSSSGSGAVSSECLGVGLVDMAAGVL